MIQIAGKGSWSTLEVPLRLVAIIPARFGSQRLPGKALADIAGVPMVERVRRRVVRARAIDRVIVATDDERIRATIAQYGGEAVLTGSHPSGTHRVAAVASTLDCDWVVNVQGDMPLLDPEHVDAIADILTSGAEVATLATPWSGPPEARDVVKVVCDRAGRALYFSRAPIPHRGPWLRHLGLYGFRRDILARLVDLPESALERSEDLEQLRWLDGGVTIRVGRVLDAETSVDTLEQLEYVRCQVERQEG